MADNDVVVVVDDDADSTIIDGNSDSDGNDDFCACYPTLLFVVLIAVRMPGPMTMFLLLLCYYFKY